MLGLADKRTFISAATLSFTILFSGSFVVTVIVLDFLPDLEPTLKVTSIFPSPPGGISLAEARAAVQPQPAFIFSMISLLLPVFLKVKVCFGLVS
jgi:hypothetical protein